MTRASPEWLASVANGGSKWVAESGHPSSDLKKVENHSFRHNRKKAQNWNYNKGYGVFSQMNLIIAVIYYSYGA